ncbi:indoleamine 2,3-dioxygenase [Entomortierella parvispora]|uniref:Indoleamine 2,3-dioxygenase n=1 Tax=Entomortierella parvispora TaxID=205924 RepID=A0A9P3LT16_9FUNG|nr:indoleamine 2,3-dioxygenase [Entomortierella parvispora]
MFEGCDPVVFYWKIRKFLLGSENNAGLGLPNGLVYSGVDNNKPKHFMGATTGQSSIFPALDVILGIQHFEKDPSPSPQQQQPSSTTRTDAETTTTFQNGQKALNGCGGGSGCAGRAPNSMLEKMRSYMPAPHRAFLSHLAQVANLRDFVLQKSKGEGFDSDPATQALAQSTACVHEVKLFRDAHIQIVTRYIITQARRGPLEGWEDYRVKIVEATAQGIKSSSHGDVETEKAPMRGSGGSDLVPFLKTNRDETQSTKVIQSASKK